MLGRDFGRALDLRLLVRVRVADVFYTSSEVRLRYLGRRVAILSAC